MTEDNAITKKEKSYSEVLAEYGVDSGPNPNFQNLSKEDFIIPRLSIGQKQSKASDDDKGSDKVPYGSIYDNLTGRIYSEFNIDPEKNQNLDIIFLNVAKGRAMFEKSSLKVVHRSNDGIHCAEFLPRKDGIILCAFCPDSKWNGQEPPSCNPQFNFLVLARDPELNEFIGPFMLTLQRTSYKDAKKVITEIGMTRLPMHAFIYRVFTTKEPSESGPYWKPNFKRLARIEASSELFKYTSSIYEQFKDANLNTDDGGESRDGGDLPF